MRYNIEFITNYGGTMTRTFNASHFLLALALLLASLVIFMLLQSMSTMPSVDFPAGPRATPPVSLRSVDPDDPSVLQKKLYQDEVGVVKFEKSSEAVEITAFAEESSLPVWDGAVYIDSAVSGQRESVSLMSRGVHAMYAEEGSFNLLLMDTQTTTTQGGWLTSNISQIVQATGGRIISIPNLAIDGHNVWILLIQ